MLEWRPEALREAETLLTQLSRAAGLPHPVHPDNSATDEGDPERALDPTPFRDRFGAAMDDDLDTGTAIGTLRDLAEAIERARAERRATDAAREELRSLAEILGVVLPAV